MDVRRKLMSKEPHEIVKEMIDLANDTPGMSYYDLKAYAYDNDKDDWLDVLRKKTPRTMIAEYLKSRHKKGTRYNHSLDESMDLCVDAQRKYEERKRNDNTRYFTTDNDLR